MKTTTALLVAEEDGGSRSVASMTTATTHPRVDNRAARNEIVCIRGDDSTAECSQICRLQRISFRRRGGASRDGGAEKKLKRTRLAGTRVRDQEHLQPR
nr:unnamed protein product [Digitaria exilis]